MCTSTTATFYSSANNNGFSNTQYHLYRQIHLNGLTNVEQCVTNTLRIRYSKHTSKAHSFTLSLESHTEAYNFSIILLTDLVKKTHISAEILYNLHRDNNYSDRNLLIYADKRIWPTFLIRPTNTCMYISININKIVMTRGKLFTFMWLLLSSVICNSVQWQRRSSATLLLCSWRKVA